VKNERKRKMDKKREKVKRDSKNGEKSQVEGVGVEKEREKNGEESRGEGGRNGKRKREKRGES